MRFKNSTGRVCIYISHKYILNDLMTDYIFCFIQIITGTPREQCPLDTPYAFSDGTKCCHDDKDRQGNSLIFTSMTCRGGEMECAKERCISNGKMVYYF